MELLGSKFCLNYEKKESHMNIKFLTSLFFILVFLWAPVVYADTFVNGHFTTGFLFDSPNSWSRSHQGHRYWHRSCYQEVFYQPVPLVISQPVIVDAVYNQPLVIMPITSSDSYTVNIPSSSGGYTAVVIRRSGDGFIGPQGEYYPQFPRVGQLQVMYGT